MQEILQGRFEKTYAFDCDTQLHLDLEQNASGSIRIYLKEGCSLLKLDILAKACSYTKLFIQNEDADHNSLQIINTLSKDAKLSTGFLDIDHGVEHLKVQTFLEEEGADYEIFTGQLCLSDKEKVGDIKIIHNHPYTYGNIHNFAVCLERGQYEMVADGTIRKGAKGSESHQETRVLTLGTGHKTQVIPLLYIDENDVKASHALSIGQPDENQLYYIESRGLNKEQAMGLLSIGYFMPVIDLVDEESEHQKLRDELEHKVGLHAGQY